MLQRMPRLLTAVACSTLLWFGPLSNAARADGQPPPLPSLQGTYAFDWHHPMRSRCTKVKGSLLRKLKKATCAPPDAGSASGHPIVAECRAKGASWLLFATAKECKEERETQLANGA